MNMGINEVKIPTQMPCTIRPIIMVGNVSIITSTVPSKDQQAVNMTEYLI